MKRMRIGNFLIVAMAIALSTFISQGRCNELRIETLAGCRIALEDEDNRLNPYDFGRNAAFLLKDYEEPWLRFTFSLTEDSGELKRPYDPLLVNDLSFGAQGIKRFSERHAAYGYFGYSRIKEREIFRALEYDQYNDPFYLTDETTGDFIYNGPTMSVDYGLRLGRGFSLGLGIDYDISTGLKQEYTAPEIVHNYLRANLGLIYETGNRWIIGLIARPIRHQNRTKFAKSEEGYDNIVYRYSGDGIFDVRTYGSYSLRELEVGAEVALQNFFYVGGFALGTELDYRYKENEIIYGSTTQYDEGYWESTAYDFKLLGRYSFRSIPLVLGFSGRVLKDEGWAKRPKFEEVLLYENPVNMQSAGLGLSYRFRPTGLIIATDYVMNRFDVEVSDYGANSYREIDVIQNIGRLGIEYSALNVYSLRAGVEYIDYLVDRWLKLPANIDSFRMTGGLLYNYGLWAIELKLAYGDAFIDDSDASRRHLSSILWFTRSIL